MPSFELLEQRNLLSLVGVVAELNPGVPDFNYDATGRLTYTAPTESAAGAFDATATPTTVIFTIGGRPVSIKDPRAFGLHIRLDAQGNVVGGVDGPDLQVDGWIDMNRNNIQDAGDYTGVLLTGEILQFGSYDSGGPNDSYDFRFQFTGGSLSPFFQGKDIGLTMTSLNSTFTGDFSAGFVGWAQGLFGPLSLNQAPVPQDQQVDTLEDTAVSGQLVATDGPMDAGKLAYALAQAPGHGSVVVNPDGSFTYTPLADYNGPDSFSFAVSDWQLTSTGTVSIDVAPVNDAPVAQGQDVNTLEDTAVSGQLVASDVDGDVLAFALAQAPSHGVVVINPDGSFAYTPEIDYNGLDSFSFTAGDGELASSAAVNVTVEPVIDPATISGQVLADGLGISGVGLTLHDADGNVVAVVQSGADGSFSFTDVYPGIYSITEAATPDYLQGDNIAGSLGGSVVDDVISGIVVSEGDAGVGYVFAEITPVSLTGTIFVDADNDGALEAGETGIAGVVVTLIGTDDLGTVSLTTQTVADGSYSFDNLRPGRYSIAASQDTAYLDGLESVGTLGGTAGDDIISEIVVGAGQKGQGYNFGELRPASLTGFVWIDFNDDGEIDFSEKTISGVTVTLTGLNDRGQNVTRIVQSDEDGVYTFDLLRPGNYTIKETQPSNFNDGVDSLGTAGGLVGVDAFSGISINQGIDGMNYNFGERPLAGTAVASGQTATIGFWQNKNGQALIKALGENTQLGDYLAATFPNLYSGLAGKTSSQVAAFYQGLFSSKAKVGGPAKVECQVMAVALATYVTNSSLAGTVATRYGFRVTQFGVGIATFNVGTSGVAFGVTNYTRVSVLDLLLATDSRSSDDVLYDYDIKLRTLANTIYTAINESGDIG